MKSFLSHRWLPSRSGTVTELARPRKGNQHHPRLILERQQHVLCMAHPRRVARVAKQIEREVGTLLLTDRVLQGAVSPEIKLGLDTAVSALASVTDVELSNDLQVAKVYISIYSDPQGKDIAMKGLSRLEGYVRKHIAQTVNLRLCPEIRFIRDDSMQRGEEVLALLERIRRQDAGEIEPPAIAIGGFRGASSEGNMDDDEDDDVEIEDDLEDEEGFLDVLDEGEEGAAEDKGDEEGDDEDDDEEEEGPQQKRRQENQLQETLGVHCSVCAYSMCSHLVFASAVHIAVSDTIISCHKCLVFSTLEGVCYFTRC
ncbi:hypothetical protein WJX75_008950 [Coccomyxa subellipsoidea]|uniref:Ribosome-binding factor A n=1 Tax=Coccomyxa subellipsoidea TaxID=248742 RepID=A0ABR2YJW9_9CHLO